jgi:hypothetical protein
MKKLFILLMIASSALIAQKNDTLYVPPNYLQQRAMRLQQVLKEHQEVVIKEQKLVDEIRGALKMLDEMNQDTTLWKRKENAVPINRR